MSLHLSVRVNDVQVCRAQGVTAEEDDEGLAPKGRASASASARSSSSSGSGSGGESSMSALQRALDSALHDLTSNGADGGANEGADGRADGGADGASGGADHVQRLQDASVAAREAVLVLRGQRDALRQQRRSARRRRPGADAEEEEDDSDDGDGARGQKGGKRRQQREAAERDALQRRSCLLHDLRTMLQQVRNLEPSASCFVSALANPCSATSPAFSLPGLSLFCNAPSAASMTPFLHILCTAVAQTQQAIAALRGGAESVAAAVEHVHETTFALLRQRCCQYFADLAPGYVSRVLLRVVVTLTSSPCFPSRRVCPL